MPDPVHPQIVLVGNPNSGKSSVFNQLTGLRQHVGNFPGVTVERKTGTCKLEGRETGVVDLPGTYSLYPTSLDERVVLNVLLDQGNASYPDAVVYVADATHLERHMLLLTQILDLGFRAVLALNMNDLAERQGITCDTALLSEQLGIPVVRVNGRTGSGTAELKQAIAEQLAAKIPDRAAFYPFTEPETLVSANVSSLLPGTDPYRALLIAHHNKKLPFLDAAQRASIDTIIRDSGFQSLSCQLDEIMRRYNRFTPIVGRVLKRTLTQTATLTAKIDAVLTNRFIGPLIFLALMVFIFQAIFAWSVIPMDWIDGQFANLSAWLHEQLPDNLFNRLLTEGLIPGISGILVFVPQITLLFFLITLLDELGYMARVVYLFDRLMQQFGLNGRSIVSLISGGACAIPAIMSTRTISNWKERLVTILVTPLISCSARIPVFAVLIGFVVPNERVWGFNLQGLVFMGLYLTGVVAALVSAFVFNKILKTEDSSFLMLELPEYRMPHWKNVFYTLYEKVSSFVFGAGKIILIVSLILWFMASFGPPGKMKEAEQVAIIESSLLQHTPEQTELHSASKKLESSFAGYTGRLIEPLIRPLGFDWKIGIALITSFAAREVFVGTISTLYSIGKSEKSQTIKAKLSKEINPETGQPVFTLAVSLSLLLFYLFAMQCISTLATVYRETRSWKWPAIQFLYMSTLAYTASFVAYHLFR